MPPPQTTQPDAEDLKQYLPNYNPTATLEPAPTKIRRHKFCPKCGYNLRGLKLGALCPECGRPTLRSARATDHDLEYLGRLHWGFRFLIISWFLLLPAMPAIIFLQVAVSLAFVAADIGYFLAILGTFLITSQDRAAKSAGIKRARRARVARVVVILGALPFAIWTCIILNLTTISLPSTFWFCSAMFALLVHQTTICFVARTLAQEMPDDPLAARFLNLGFAIPCLGIFGLPMTVALLSMPIGFLFFPLAILPLLYAITEIVFMVALYSLLTGCAWAARYQYHEEEKNQRLRQSFKKTP